MRPALLAAAICSLASLLVPSAVLADGQTQTQTAAPSAQLERERADWHHFGGQETRDQLGTKMYKERINLVARKPLRHDVEWLDSRDRWSWQGHEKWQGIRDARPMIARKTLGFHAPRPHVPRRERILRIGRGPIRGPGFSE